MLTDLKMEEDVPERRKWEDMHNDNLVKIFQTYDISKMAGMPQVCRSWRYAVCYPFLWRTLDLSMLESNFIKTSVEPYVYVDEPSDKELTRILKISLNLSLRNITTLIFHFNLYVRDDQLTYTAERCPKLKRLVLPAWNLITETGLFKAINSWKDLESLTMPSISDPVNIMEKISINCKNFSQLKIMGPCDIFFAHTLVTCLPNLKVLSLRCSMLDEDALLILLDGLKHLEVLNISHCIIDDLDESTLEKASRLREFFTCLGPKDNECEDNVCVMCNRTEADEGFLRWYKYEEGLWKEDEVKSLAI
ncbi:hypothetical protein R6Q59_019783 [Mikania micrantha]